MSDKSKTGYGNPPKSSRWQKGQSGNPKGRPKSKNLSTADSIRDIMKERIAITVNGHRRKVPPMAAAIYQTLSATLKSGKPRDLKILFEQLDKYGGASGHDFEEGEFVTYASMKQGADDVMTKIRTIFDRTAQPGGPKEKLRAEQTSREVQIILASTAVKNGLLKQWRQDDAQPGSLSLKTELRTTIEAHLKSQGERHAGAQSNITPQQ